jgi:hypothetical protein
MWEWILIGVLWALNIGLLRWLGGVAAAGEAIESWGSRRAAAQAPGRRRS